MVNYQSLVGRKWEYGLFDCFSLIRDYYKLLGVDFPDYQRPDDLETCESIFLDQASVLKFKQIDFNLRLPNDVLIMKLGTKTPMHAAILLGNEQILHQKLDSLSCVELLSNYYRRSTKAVFRYAA
jgi:cell wall-associated NlpC family hydrolase